MKAELMDPVMRAVSDRDRLWWNGHTPPGWYHPETNDRMRALSSAAIAVVLSEIDAELERRIAEDRYSVSERSVGRRSELESLRDYIRALGNGGEHDEH